MKCNVEWVEQAIGGHQKNQISPDVLTSAKGLGNGFPIGACLTSSKFNNIFEPGNHGSTFGGNLLHVLHLLKQLKLLKMKNY